MRDQHPTSGKLTGETLVRYVAGASDRRERAIVEAWADASAARREYLAALQRSWARARAGASDDDLRETDAAWSALRARLGGYESALHAGEELGDADAPRGLPLPRSATSRRAFVIPGTGRHTSAHSPWLRAAAAVLLLAAGALALRHYIAGPATSTVVAARPSPMREVVTGIGERARIRLEDGSTIVLAARSRLGIPADFGVHAREVETEGEAYFRVVHDSTLPFIVHARGSRTVDLGTAFVVRAYPDDPQVSVVVSEGRVALGADSRADSTHAPASAATLLARGEMGSLRTGERVPTVTAVDPGSYTGWVDGRLSFDNAPLPDVISDLGRWHTTKIVLADSSLARETVTASLAADSFDEALRTLTTVLSLRAERHGSTVVLYRRRGSH